MTENIFSQLEIDDTTPSVTNQGYSSTPNAVVDELLTGGESFKVKT
jgi:hypothetical protein